MPRKKPSWVNYKPEEVEELVLKLHTEGKTSSQIGIQLRDQYGIPLVKEACGKTIMQIIKKPEIPEDLFNLLKRAVNLRNHLVKNKRDAHSKRGLQKAESQIRDLAKYYIRKKQMPSDWRYDPEKAKLLVQK